MPPHDDSISTETLDFLRGVAAVYVVINHTRGHFFKGGSAIISEAGSAALSLFDHAALAILQLTSLGTEFVILFFCVSGIAMAHSIALAPNRLHFYKKRAIRIWPPYIAAVILSVAICYGMALVNRDNFISVACSAKLDNAIEVAKMLFYVQPKCVLTPQFWSLPYEVIFYTFCPLLLYSKGSVLLSFVGSCLLAIVGAVHFGITINPSDSVFVNFLINALLWFMCGAAGYHYYDKIPKFRPALFWSLSGILLLCVWVVKKIAGDSNLISNIIMICLTLMAIRNLPARLTGLKFCNWGAFSYSIYIFHFAIIMLIYFILAELFSIKSGEISNYFLWIVFLPPILLGCWVLYFFTERPCNNYLKQLRAVERGKAAQVAAAMASAENLTTPADARRRVDSLS